MDVLACLLVAAKFAVFVDEAVDGRIFLAPASVFDMLQVGKESLPLSMDTVVKGVSG